MLTVAHNIFVFHILFSFKQIDYLYIEAQVYKNNVTCHRYTELGHRYMYLVEAPWDYIMLCKNLFKLRIVQLYLMLYIKSKQRHPSPSQWRHNERSGVSNHQPHDCLRNRLFRCRLKENIKAPRNWTLWGEFTGNRWIPRTKDQQRGKCFRLMTSSWWRKGVSVYSPICVQYES